MPKSNHKDATPSEQVKTWARKQYDRYVEFEKRACQVIELKRIVSQAQSDDTSVNMTQDLLSKLREAALSPDFNTLFKLLEEQSYNQIITEPTRQDPMKLELATNELTKIDIDSSYAEFTNVLERSFKELSPELEKHKPHVLKDILFAFEDGQKRNHFFIQHVIMSIFSLTPLLENNEVLKVFNNPRHFVFEDQLSLSGQPVFNGLLYSGALIETSEQNIHKYYRQFNISYFGQNWFKDLLSTQRELHACLQKNPRVLHQEHPSALSIIRELTRMSWVYSDGQGSMSLRSDDPFSDLVRAYPELPHLVGVNLLTGDKQSVNQLHKMRLRWVYHDDHESLHKMQLQCVYHDDHESMISLSDDPFISHYVRAYPELAIAYRSGLIAGHKKSTKQFYEMRLRLYAEWNKTSLISSPPRSPSNAELGGVFMRLCDDVILNLLIIAIDSAHEKKSRDEVSVPLVHQLPCDKKVTTSYSLPRRTRHECIKENVELAHKKLSTKTGIRQRSAANLLKHVGCDTDLMTCMTSRDIFYCWLSLLPNKDQQDIVDHCVKETCRDYDVANLKINSPLYRHLQALMVLGCSKKLLDSKYGKLSIYISSAKLGLRIKHKYSSFQQWQNAIQVRGEVSLDQLRALQYKLVAGTDPLVARQRIEFSYFKDGAYSLNDKNKTFHKFPSRPTFEACLFVFLMGYAIDIPSYLFTIVLTQVTHLSLAYLANILWNGIYEDYINNQVNVLKQLNLNHVEQKESRNQQLQRSKKQRQRQHQNSKKQRVPENDENETVTLIEKTSKSAPSAPSAPLTTQCSKEKQSSEKGLLKALEDKIEEKIKIWEGEQRWGKATRNLLKVHLLNKCDCIDDDTLTAIFEELDRQCRINDGYIANLKLRIEIEPKQHLIHLKTVIFAVCEERRQQRHRHSPPGTDSSEDSYHGAVPPKDLITQESSLRAPASGTGEGEGKVEVDRKEDSDDSDSVSSDESTHAESVDHAFNALIKKIKASHLQLHKVITDFDTETAALSNLFNDVLALLNAIESPDCELSYTKFKHQLIHHFKTYDELVKNSSFDESPGYDFISSFRQDLDQVQKLVGSSTNEDITDDLGKLANRSPEQHFVFMQFAKMEIVTPSFFQGKATRSSPLISPTSTAFSWKELIPADSNVVDFLSLCRFLMEHALHERLKKNRETANEYLHRNFVVSEFPSLSIPKETKRCDIRAEQHIASAQFFLQQLLNHFHELESVDRWGVLCIVTDRLRDAIKLDQPGRASEHVKQVKKLTDSSKRRDFALPHYKAMRESRNGYAHEYYAPDKKTGSVATLVDSKREIQIWHDKLSTITTNDQTTRATKTVKRT